MVFAVCFWLIVYFNGNSIFEMFRFLLESIQQPKYKTLFMRKFFVAIILLSVAYFNSQAQCPELQPENLSVVPDNCNQAILRGFCFF